MNPDPQKLDDLDELDQENPDFIDRQFNPDIFNDNLKDFDASKSQNPDHQNRDDYEDEFDFDDNSNGDQIHELDSTSINDDMCYYLKPPSTALLNVKVLKFKILIAHSSRIPRNYYPF